MYVGHTVFLSGKFVSFLLGDRVQFKIIQHKNSHLSLLLLQNCTHFNTKSSSFPVYKFYCGARAINHAR